ncbi:SRPBCC family protein [Arthrobacter rhombi]
MEQTMSEKEITASRTIDAPADTLFSVLSNPERHAELDGSGLVQSDDKSDRITAVGQMFTMNMHWEKMGGDYKTDNHVVGFDENKLLAWETAPQGQQPPGWQWVWELEPQGPDSTKVSVTYDWSSVTDKDVLKQISFPAIPQEDLESSLGNLASAVSQV